MKTKHLFASVALASAFVGCSQEELVNTNNEMQALGNRPMVEAPVLDFGVASRMTTDSNGNFATVEWKEGDGFGAAVMDNYNAAGTTWADMFPIQNYINSNVLFSYNSATGKFEADASMPMGNHLFYAPFNKANISREPLAVSIPLTQVVSKVEGREVSNSVITSFYEDGTKPVFFAYDKVEDEAKTSLSLSLNHIFALPHVTLNLGEVRLSDAYNDANENKNKDANENYTDLVDELTIKKIVFVNTNKSILSSGTISNAAVKEQLEKDDDGNYLWKTNQYESNTTASLLNTGDYNKTTNKNGQVKDEEITVEFEGGMTISEAENGRFIMVLPGAEYNQADLAIKVYATIDGEDYLLVKDLTATTKTAETLEPERDLRLLPGLPYAADEYNANGTAKASKGTSFAYNIEGPLHKIDAEVVDGYYEISNYTELKEYIENVAYRGKALVEMSKEDAIEAIEKGNYEPKKNFVITAKAEEPIVIDAALVDAFNNACVIQGGSASLTFLGGNAKVVLGTMTYDMDAVPFKFTNKAMVSGDLSLKGAEDLDFNDGLGLLETASVDLTANLTQAVNVENMNNATVNINSSAAHTITNAYGELNVNVSTAAKITNGAAVKPEAQKNNDSYFGIMSFADGVRTTGTIGNLALGKATLEKATVTMETNNGEIVMNVKAQSRLTVNSGVGKIDNTIASKVTASTNEVYATVNTLDGLDEIYDNLTGLNKLVVNDVLDTTPLPTNVAIKTIDFEEGSGIYFEEGTLDLSSLKTININADVVWEGRDETKAVVKVAKDAIKENVKTSTPTKTYYELTIIDIAVSEYNFVDSARAFAAAIAEGGNITLTENVSLTETLELTKDAVIDLNGKTLTVGEGENGCGINVESGDVVVKNGSVSSNGWGFWLPNNSTAKLKLIECNVSATSSTNNVVAAFGGELIIEGGEYNNKGAVENSDKGYVIAVKGGANATINTKVNTKGTNGGAITVLEGSTVEITGGEYHAKEWHALNINGSVVNYSNDVVFTTVNGLKHVQVYEKDSIVNGEEKTAGSQWNVE